jgi:hypothetical protein
VSNKTVRDEIAALTDAVHELRDREVADTLRDLRAEVERLRAERGAHHCMHATPWFYTGTYPLTVTCGSAGNINVPTLTASAVTPVWGSTIAADGKGGGTVISEGYTLTATN